MEECETTEQSGKGSGFESGNHLPGSSTTKPEWDRFFAGGGAELNSIGQK
jgi:hypothetical protein